VRARAHSCRLAARQHQRARGPVDRGA
jgi:hypothetical protein